MMSTKTLASGLLVASLFCALPASAQEESKTDLLSGFSILGNPSVIGSNGFLYIVTGSKNSPKLEAYDLDAATKGPVGTYKFSGYPTHLEIGKDNRLYLVVTQTSARVSAADTGTFSATTPNFIFSPTKTKLYIIPTPFPASAPGATLESSAVEADEWSNLALTAVVQVELEGNIRSLKVKAVGDKEYLYILTNSFQLSPLKFTSKLHIYDSDGKKIKDATLE